MPMMDNASIAALSGPVPTGLNPVSPRKNNVSTKNGRVRQSTPGTKLAPRLSKVSAPVHRSRARAKKVSQNGIATLRAQSGY